MRLLLEVKKSGWRSGSRLVRSGGAGRLRNMQAGDGVGCVVVLRALGMIVNMDFFCFLFFGFILELCA